jgi:hypothetical protein
MKVKNPSINGKVTISLLDKRISNARGILLLKFVKP